MKEDFNRFRFGGLNFRECSNKYITMDRVNEDATKIVVKISYSHLVKSRYGYGLILDYNHVVWIKDWQVSNNYFGIEVLLTKEYFNVKETSLPFGDFGEDPKNLEWDTWVEVAKAQDGVLDKDGFKANPVKWSK